MNNRSVFGCLALAAALIAASVGHAQARSRLAPPSPSPGAAAVILGDKSLGETYLVLPAFDGRFGLIQFTGSPYRARHTNIYIGTCIASVPLTIPWLFTVVALGLIAVVLLLPRSTDENEA